MADPTTNTTAGATSYIAITEDHKVQISGYDGIVDAERVVNINPPELNFVYDKLELATTTGSITVDMDGYGEIYAQLDIDSGAIGIEGSLDYTATASAAVYLPITSEFTGSTALITADTIMIDDSGIGGGFKYVKFVATANSTLTLWLKRKLQI